MSTRKSHAAGTHAVAEPVPFNDLPRQQLAAGTQATCAILRGFESIRRIQQSAAHHALAQHEEVAEKLKEPCQPLDLLAAQADLVRSDMQGAVMYWQQLASAVLDMQRELLGGLPSAARDAESGVQGHAATSGLNPFFFNVTAPQPATTS